MKLISLEVNQDLEVALQLDLLKLTDEFMLSCVT